LITCGTAQKIQCSNIPIGCDQQNGLGGLLVHCRPPICRRTAVFPDGENIILFLQRSRVRINFPLFCDLCWTKHFISAPVIRLWRECQLIVAHTIDQSLKRGRWESQVTLQIAPTHKNIHQRNFYQLRDK
jgi:hypothetical protein